MKRGSRAAVPGIRPGSQRLSSPVWAASKARGTAADTAGAMRREEREMAGPRREASPDGFASRAEGRRFEAQARTYTSLSRKVFVARNPGALS